MILLVHPALAISMFGSWCKFYVFDTFSFSVHFLASPSAVRPARWMWSNTLLFSLFNTYLINVVLHIIIAHCTYLPGSCFCSASKRKNSWYLKTENWCPPSFLKLQASSSWILADWEFLNWFCTYSILYFPVKHWFLRTANTWSLVGSF